jgi:4-amino-4-deoxy-L-arabinose transferase-like glycosyltransferase
VGRLGLDVQRVLHRGQTLVSRHGYVFAIVVLGVSLRLAHFAALRSTLWFDNLDLDPAYYDAWAQRIAAGDWLGSQLFFVDPLYAYFLGGLYALFGHSLLVVRLVQVGIGVCTIILVFVLGTKIGGRSTGPIAAFVYAIYGPAIFNEIEVEKTALATFLLLAAVTLVLWGSSKGILLGGVGLALAVLSRGNVLALMVPLALYTLMRDQRWNPKGMFLFLAGCGLVLLPVLWRNQQVGGEYDITTSLGQNLYQGNNPYNTSGTYGNVPFVRSSPTFEEVDYQTEAERRVGKNLTPGQISTYWAAEAARHILSHPDFAVEMIWRKLQLVLNDYEVPDNSDYYFLARYSPVLRWTPLSFGWLLPFAALGILSSWRRRESQLIAAVLLIYVATIVAFFVVGRFRLLVVPLLIVYAALGFGWLVRQAREPKRRRVVLGLAAVWLVVCLPFTLRELPFPDRQVSGATNWRNLGSMQAQLGRFDAAAGSYERALALQPNSDLLTSEVALVYLQLGRLADAEQALVRTTELTPNSPVAWVSLGRLYQDTERPTLAIIAFQRAVVLDPTNASVRSHLGSLLGSQPLEGPAKSVSADNLMVAPDTRGITMVKVPAGPFQMGSNGGVFDERPTHTCDASCVLH